jgi:catechol 2,3-dioxygenase-like lactoylglutathione lyase family enzyme
MTNVSVRYIVDDVAASIEFYVRHLDFTLEQDARPCLWLRYPRKPAIIAERSR